LVRIIKAAKNYLRRLPSALLHGCRTKTPEHVRDLLSTSKFYLQDKVPCEWAMLGSNQQPLLGEGSKIGCWMFLELSESLQIAVFLRWHFPTFQKMFSGCCTDVTLCISTRSGMIVIRPVTWSPYASFVLSAFPKVSGRCVCRGRSG
jgi:hypothetical protein